MANNILSKQNKKKGWEMYFSYDVSKRMAELEQNEKNFAVARIVDRVLMQVTADTTEALRVAELGGGAHPDRYHDFFAKLLNTPRGHIDWIDISPHMLVLGKKYIDTDEYLERLLIIDFIESDILDYLESISDDTLDIAIMKYTIDHVENIDKLFGLLAKKLKPGAKLVATIGTLNPQLKSYSTNARYLYNGEIFSDDETRTLRDGDNFTIKFFKVSGDKNSGYLEGGEVIKYFHSEEKMRSLADSMDLDIYLGDWKEFVKAKEPESEKMDQDILVLHKI